MASAIQGGEVSVIRDPKIHKHVRFIPDSNDDDNSALADDQTELLEGNENSYSTAWSDDSQGVQGAKLIHGDFMSMITTISQAHHKGRHLDRRPLDDYHWDELGAGQTFHVSRSNLDFETAQATNRKATTTISKKTVIKKTKQKLMSDTEIRVFNKELRILAHMYGDPNIVALRGIGWFYRIDLQDPSPQPAFMFEEAVGTLSILIGSEINLTTRNLMAVFQNIANGLSALHDCGIVHGDLKPDNILLFKDYRYEEGDRVETYIANISDFSLAMFDNGGLQRKLGGSRQYQAPEVCGDHGTDPLSFSQLKLCDVYSLGMLYAVVASESEDILELSTTDILYDHNDTIDGLESRIIERSKNDIESSAVDTPLKHVVEHLFSCTLQVSPSCRRLDLLIESFNLYFGTQDEVGIKARALFDPDPADLTISYGKLGRLSGVLKDKMVEGLQVIASDPCDPRYPKALFELAIINLSHYVSPSSSIQDGLKYIELSAEAGDLRGEGFFRRIYQAYGETSDELVESDRDLKWLFEAASNGYQVAIEDLRRLDPKMAKKALIEFAAKSMGYPLELDAANQYSYQIQLTEILARGSSINEGPTSNGHNTIAHWAATTGNVELLLELLQQYPDCQEVRNDIGDTPLLSAARFGQYETTLVLLIHGADASSINTAKENAFHFLWRFDCSEASVLMKRLLERGANPLQAAQGYETPGFLDVLPTVPGTPIERVASRNRVDLVELFIENGVTITPRNGNLMRRMLLMAMRLQHVEMQDFLVGYASTAEDVTVLRPLHKVRWDYKGTRRSYLDASILGWVFQTGYGIDIPLGVWRACYHGTGKDSKLQASIWAALRLDRTSMPFDENLIDSSLMLAVDELDHEAFEFLLNIKLLVTNASSGRLTSLKSLVWKAIVSNDNQTQNYYEDLQENQEDQDNSFSQLVQLYAKPDEDNVSTPNPVVSVNYIDQILYQPGKGTLAQQALLSGDRTLFYITVHKYKANLALPFHLEGMAHQINCYSALAYSKHRDLWFSNKLHQMKIQLCCPFDSPPQGQNTGNFWTAPLYDALFNRSWGLSHWLIEKGASLCDKSKTANTVLEDIVSPLSLHEGLLEFLFPEKDNGNTAWCTPTDLKTSNGYPIFYHIYLGVYKAISLKRHYEDISKDWRGSGDLPYTPGYHTPEAKKLLSCWLNLLKYYPSVENLPQSKNVSVLGMTSYLYEKLFYKLDTTIGFDLMIVPEIRVRVKFEASNDGYDYGISAVPVPRVLKKQTIAKLLQSIILGSRVDQLSLGEFWSSGLWRYNHWPSMWHLKVAAYLEGLAVLTVLFAIYLCSFLGCLLYWGWSAWSILLGPLGVTMQFLFLISPPAFLIFGCVLVVGLIWLFIWTLGMFLPQVHWFFFDCENLHEMVLFRLESLLV